MILGSKNPSKGFKPFEGLYIKKSQPFQIVILQYSLY